MDIINNIWWTRGDRHSNERFSMGYHQDGIFVAQVELVAKPLRSDFIRIERQGMEVN